MPRPIRYLTAPSSGINRSLYHAFLPKMFRSQSLGFFKYHKSILSPSPPLGDMEQAKLDLSLHFCEIADPWHLPPVSLIWHLRYRSKRIKRYWPETYGVLLLRKLNILLCIWILPFRIMLIVISSFFPSFVLSKLLTMPESTCLRDSCKFKVIGKCD